MAQASLTPGPGTVILDADEVDLTDEASHEVSFPCTVTFVAEWDASTEGDVVELEASNDDFVDDIVHLGALYAEGGAGGNNLTADVYRSHVRATPSGTINLTLATIRGQHDRINGDN